MVKHLLRLVICSASAARTPEAISLQNSRSSFCRAFTTDVPQGCPKLRFRSLAEVLHTLRETRRAAAFYSNIRTPGRWCRVDMRLLSVNGNSTVIAAKVRYLEESKLCYI
jgi:hypothetical protein